MGSPILSDSFSDSPISTRGPRWTRVTRYWPTLLWNDGAETVTGFAITPSNAELHDKYRAESGVVAARTDPTYDEEERVCAAFTHRLDSREDTTVKATFKLVDVSGGAQDFWTDNFWAGVGARITGETGTEFTTGSNYTEMLVAPSGYYFWLMSRKASGATAVISFAIMKVVGPGTAGADSTSIEVLTSALWSTGTQDELFANSTFGLRFSCETVGATTELRGYYTDPSGVETEVVSHDEGTGGLTEAGHALVACVTEMKELIPSSPPQGAWDASALPFYPGYGFVMGIVDFEIQDANGDLVMRDDFERVQQVAARQAGADAFWTTANNAYGHLVTGMFTGDEGSEDATGELPQFGDRLRRHASTEKLEMLLADATGYHLFHQPPSSIYTQSVQIEADFDAGGENLNRLAGVCLRRSLGENADYEGLTIATESSGYTVAMHYAFVSGAGVWALRLHRFSGAGWLMVAFRVLNASGDPTSVALATSWTLRADIVNRDGAGSGTGNVNIDTLLNGERLTGWTITDGSGLIEEDNGSLTDTSSERVLSGGATGFFVANMNAGPTDEVFILNAQQIEPDLTATSAEQRSVYVRAEKDGATGTLTVPHEWPVETRYEDYVAVHELDTAQVSRHEQASAQRRRWKIASGAAKRSEVDDLRDFFRDHLGSEIPFNWTTPDGEAVVVAMEKHSLSIQKLDINAYDFGVTLVELVGDPPQVGATVDFLNSNQAFSGGGFEIVDDPVGTGGPTFSAVFHFKDSYGAVTISISLDTAARGGEIVVVDLSGDAVEGTHYTNNSDPGSNKVILEASEGDTTLTFTFTTIATGKWHPERRLIITVNATETNVPVHPLNNILHAWIRSTTPPPELEFDAVSQSVAAGNNAIIQVNKPTGNAHEDPVRVYLEEDATSTAVEGEDFDWPLSPADPYGLYTIDNSTTSRDVSVRIHAGADTSRILVLNLRHEPADRSERNFWSRSDSLEFQQNENTPKIYAGDPSDNAPGPGDVLPPNPLDSWNPSDLTDPWGRNTVTVLKLRDVARGAGYHRKDFKGQTQGGAPHDTEGGGMMSMTDYVRYSMYLMVAKPNGEALPFPRFIRMGVRDRGFSLSPPQVPNLTGLGEQNYSVIFDTETTGGVTDGDGNIWSVYGYAGAGWPTSGEHGIEIETLRWPDGTTQDVARVWVIYHEEDANRIGHAMVRIWYPIYFGQGVGGEGENLGNNKGKAVAAFWPMLETSASVLTGAPPLYHQRHGFFDGPLGGALAVTSGILTHTVNIT